MDSDGRLFPDDVPVDFFGECAECENAIEKLMTYWKQIGVMYPMYLQVHIRSMEWMELLGVFVDQWGVDCCDADLLRCCKMVREE